jgi:hypothetical protein
MLMRATGDSGKEEAPTGSSTGSKSTKIVNMRGSAQRSSSESTRDSKKSEKQKNGRKPAEGPAAGGETTLMIRNIPNRTKATRLLEMIDEAGFTGAYDYVYMPLDSQTLVNKGYAFVNFTEPTAAHSFAAVVESLPMESGRRSSKRMVASPAKLQGVNANLQALSEAREASCPLVRIGGVLTEVKANNLLKGDGNLLPQSMVLPSGGSAEWVEALHADPREGSALRTPSPEWVSEWPRR